MALRAVLDWYEKHNNELPREKQDDEQTKLRGQLRWHRRSKTLSAAARELLQRIETIEESSRHAQQSDAAVARAERELLQGHQLWCEEHDVHHADDSRKPTLHRSRGGRFPYPSFSNLYHTCYLNASLQCLLHCGAARAALLASPQGNEEAPEVIEDLWE